MKILLDECLPRDFAELLRKYRPKTVPQMGWAGAKNGQLLGMAEKKFDVFVTADQNLVHQQNIKNFNIAIVVLFASRIKVNDLKTLIPQLEKALADIRPQSVISVYQDQSVFLPRTKKTIRE